MLTRWNDFPKSDFDRTFAALGDLRHEMDRLFQRFESEESDLPAVRRHAHGQRVAARAGARRRRCR